MYIYGKNVVDNTYYQGIKYDNKGRQYDSFREKENRVDVDDFKDYIIPRPVKQVRRAISVVTYKMKENEYLLERNAQFDSLGTLSNIAF